MSLILADTQILSRKECASISDAVRALSPHWINRKHALPFYTLGAASYLDASLNNPLLYAELSSRYNSLLHDNFLWLHRRTCETLAEILHEPVELHARLALPGFHVFLAHVAFAQEEAASAHWDLQFQKINWCGEQPDFTQPISFTLPVCLPQSGAGLNLWDISYCDAGALKEKQREAIRAMFSRQFHPYATGRIVIHSGLYLHQIAPMRDTIEGEQRITYQGHALRFGNTWRLYW